ncbi:MAG: hypothetical protein K6F28_03040 [Lachnospiraceae bacterium]|nr:hypothetical protein [Lachnospiraceae bacterium]
MYKIGKVVLIKGNEEFCTMLRCKDGSEPGEINELKELTRAVSDLYSEVEKKLSKSKRALKKYDTRGGGM